MLLPPKIAAGVRDGSVTLAFRRWAAPRVKVGGTFTTVAGVVIITSVEQVEAASIDQAQADAAGAVSPEAVVRATRGGDDVPLFKVGLAFHGDDPRIALREVADLSDADVADLAARLARLDRSSSSGPWTYETLRLIEAHPQRRAPDLAAIVGRQTASFKLDVRKLKGLGLTISFPVGYEVSPRGRELLRRRPN